MSFSLFGDEVFGVRVQPQIKLGIKVNRVVKFGNDSFNNLFGLVIGGDLALEEALIDCENNRHLKSLVLQSLTQWIVKPCAGAEDTLLKTVGARTCQHRWHYKKN